MKTTKKQITNYYNNIISVGYCDAWYLLRGYERRYHTEGVYGWNADVYHINNQTAIVTGYRPFGNIAGNEHNISKYNEEACNIYNDDTLTYNEQIDKIEAVLMSFISECVN